MNPCPTCGRPMPTDTYRQRRLRTCSRTCGISLGNTKRQTRNTEVDPVAVDRLVAGDPPPWSSRAERLEAARLLTSRGYSLFAIALRLHMTDRSVSRYRAELHRKAVA